ncbi:MAG: NPCBM/NEW2 domain-containing protein [Gemmataceae bacterium]
MKMLRAAACLLVAASAGSAAELNTLKGKKITGELVSVNDQAIVLKTATGEVTTPLPEAMVLQLSAAAEPKLPEKYTDVELIDGTLFHCKSFVLTDKGKSIELTALPDKKIKLPLAKVAYILNDAQDPQVQREWQDIFADRGKQDRFFLRQGNRLDGLPGTFGEADDKSIHFDLAGGGSRKLPIDRLAALLFNNRMEGNIPPTLCKVVDAHRNTVIANKTTLAEGKLTIVTVGGATIEYPTLTPVVMMDYSRDKVVYLSDMRFKEENAFGETTVRCGKDVNLDNQPITVDGVAYGKGLVVHAGVQLTFDLAADYKELKVVLGYDMAANSVSDVKVTFVADGRPLFATDVHRNEKPQPITLDVKKVRQLRITVTPTEGLFIGRQIALADAKVTK